MNTKLRSALAGALVLATTACGTAQPPTGNAPGGGTSEAMHWTSPPSMQIDKGKQYQAVVTTNYGDFTIQLLASDTPRTVNNFVFLAKHNFYAGNRFFRIIKTFMVQTGDPDNNGTGGPGYQFSDELPPKYPYGPGIVAMANAGPDTNGSQFFICTGKDSANLNAMPNYTEFGKVVKGMDVVEKIADIPVAKNPQSPNGEISLPTKDAHIEKIDIVESP